jgi:2'-hydroxyisoflavone reductase
MARTRRDFIRDAVLAAAAAATLPMPVLGTTAKKKMLILGGTSFIGPHQVRTALARGHEVAIFNRGRTAPGMFGKEVEQLIGDRNNNLDALKGRKWDVVIDNSAESATNAPEWVKFSGEVLKDSTDQYLFISTRSAYRDTSRVPMTADAPTRTMEDVAAGANRDYGTAKAMAEREAQAAFGTRTTIVRPGLIVGPTDDTDRFTYWPWRIARGGEVLVPGDGTDRVQIIDVRDLGEFVIKLAEDRTYGVFNGVGPQNGRPFKEFAERIKKAVGGDATFTWVAADFLIANGVRPYSAQMPVFQPMSGRTAGFARFDLTPELKAGLKFRSLETTAKETLDWFNTLTAADRPNGIKTGLKPEKEKELLALWHAKRASGG